MIRVPGTSVRHEIRRAITRFSLFGEASPEGGWEHLDAAIELSRDAFAELVRAQSQAIDAQDPKIFDEILEALLTDGTIPVFQDTAADVLAFFQHFDPTPTQIVPVTIHPPISAARSRRRPNGLAKWWPIGGPAGDKRSNGR